jgi:hypothetical protein
LGSLEPQFVFIEPDGTIDVTFSGKMENGVPGTVYKATLINLDESTYIKPRAKASCLFTIMDQTSGISTIESTANSATQVVYDLQGRRVERLQSGIYVKNGRKIVIK